MKITDIQKDSSGITFTLSHHVPLSSMSDELAADIWAQKDRLIAGDMYCNPAEFELRPNGTFAITKTAKDEVQK